LPNKQFMEMTGHLCSDARPSRYLNGLLASGAWNDYPFSMLAELQKTPQSPRHHPEGNVWKHTCLVVDQAARVKDQSGDPAAFMWAALLHDIGKPGTTRKRREKITSYGHDKAGMHLAVQFLSALTEDRALIERAAALVRYHMQPLFVTEEMPFAEIAAMKRETDPREVALLGYCDRMGRTGSDAGAERVHALAFLRKCGIRGELRI
jgi:putative nucleotidyltransferase with HDIG domain